MNGQWKTLAACSMEQFYNNPFVLQFVLVVSHIQMCVESKNWNEW